MAFSRSRLIPGTTGPLLNPCFQDFPRSIVSWYQTVIFIDFDYRSTKSKCNIFIPINLSEAQKRLGILTSLNDGYKRGIISILFFWLKLWIWLLWIGKTSTIKVQFKCHGRLGRCRCLGDNFKMFVTDWWNDNPQKVPNTMILSPTSWNKLHHVTKIMVTSITVAVMVQQLNWPAK